MNSNNGAVSTEVFTNGKAAKILEHFKSSAFPAIALVYINNPVGFVAQMRALNLTKIVKPDDSKVDPVIRRLISRKDFKDIKTLMTSTPYLSTANNWSVNPNLWAALYTTQGDFLSLFNTYVEPSK